ncbi:MAG TPA: ROK family protein [Verrucomicrobiae bacterium]|nr:ROK family protein [Verrucomicrobiae bacterium]
MKRRSSAKRVVVGIDLGGTKILAAVYDEKHRLLAREKKATRAELGPQAVVKRAADCVYDALAAAALPHTAIAAVGVGVPGMIDARGSVLVAPNLHWRNFPFGKLLSKRLDIPVTVVNDVQAGTMAVQHYGAGRGLQDFVCMFIGTGIGGGLVLRGEQYRGAGGMGGEIGHMVVVAYFGPKCGCGNYGCLEAVASRSAIVRRVIKAMEDGQKTVVRSLCDGDTSRIRSRILAEAYRQDDKLVREIVNDASHYIGIGAANLINVLNPQAVILGGGLIEALGNRMLPRIKKAAFAHTIAASDERVNILDSGLGDDAGILGGALAARKLAKL